MNNGWYRNGSWEIRMGWENNGTMLGGNIITTEDMESKDDGIWDYIYLLAPRNEWQHVVITYNGSKYFFYLQGAEQEGSEDIKGEIVSRNTPLTIGQAGHGKDDEYFYGLIDEVRIYKRALSESDVKALYNIRNK